MRRSLASLAVSAIALATVASGCGASGDRPSERLLAAAPPSPGRALGLAAVAVDARIGRDRVVGSGSVIDADRGLVLTSAHTVWGARSLRLHTGLGVLYGRIVARAPCEDLALVETQPRLPGLAALRPEPGGLARSGDRLTAVVRRKGAPTGGGDDLLELRASPQTGSVRVRIDPELPLLRDVLRLDRLVPEASGAALLDAQGRFVAVAQAGGRASAAVPAATVTRLLGELRPGAKRRYRGWGRYYRCTPKLHAYARSAHPGFRPSDAKLGAPVPATRLPGAEGLDG